MSTPLLEVRGVLVEFGGFKALNDVDLTVQRNELRFLIGPNGAGKTTLLDLVTGLVRCKAGDVLFDGQRIDRLAEFKRVHLGIGRSFQTPTVFEALTVLENVDMASAFRRRLVAQFRPGGRVPATVATVLERVGLAAHAQRPAAVLSHGQKQWLEIAMLLVQDPKLLLLDEPVAGMSTSERLATGELLQDLASDHTVVVVEHDMAFLRRFASSVTVLHEGRILAEGDVETVQADPKVREVYLGRSRDERAGHVPAGQAGDA